MSPPNVLGTLKSSSVGWQLVLERARSMDMSCAGGWGIGGGVRVGQNRRGGGGLVNICIINLHLDDLMQKVSLHGGMMGTCFLV